MTGTPTTVRIGLVRALVLAWPLVIAPAPAAVAATETRAPAGYCFGKPVQPACIELAAASRSRPSTGTVVMPWGVQIAQSFSAATARRAFEQVQRQFKDVLGSEELMLVARPNPDFGPDLRYTAEVGRNTRAAAERLCARLQRAGGTCIVMKN